jgi:hypothetical protein
MTDVQHTGFLSDSPEDLAALAESVKRINVDAVIAMMGWEADRIPGTSRIRLAEPDGCGVCSTPCREYDVRLGIPLCSRTCEELTK